MSSKTHLVAVAVAVAVAVQGLAHVSTPAALAKGIVRSPQILTLFATPVERIPGQVALSLFYMDLGCRVQSA